jgi:hypothetical protein
LLGLQAPRLNGLCCARTFDQRGFSCAGKGDGAGMRPRAIIYG